MPICPQPREDPSVYQAFNRFCRTKFRSASHLEFNKIEASGAAEIANNSVVAGLPVLIPYSTEQGIILAEQGIFAREQGFFPARIEVNTP